MATVAYGSVPFTEQNEFFRRKLRLPTRHWTDIYTYEHDYAFVVAGAHRDEIVADFQTAVGKIAAQGATLADFRKDFDHIVDKHQWDYTGGRNWRSRVIYETNLRTSYAAGRYEQLQQLKKVRPFWRYLHSDAVVHPRPQHLAWDNLVLPADDPWWDTHFGPNGWGCQCTVEALNQRDLNRLGLKVGTAPPIEWEDVTIGKRSPNGPQTVRVPTGIDPGFEYTPGRARLQSAIPPEKPDPPLSGSTGGPGLPNRRPPGELPAPRKVPANRLLPANLSDDEYLARFMAEFNATVAQPVIYRDVIGEALVIGSDLFTAPQGVVKIAKRGRERFLKLLADTIKSPDEIWARIEWHYALKTAVVRRRYVARYEIAGNQQPMLAVFDLGDDGWYGVTTYQSADHAEDAWRIGVRLYRRDEQ